MSKANCRENCQRHELHIAAVVATVSLLDGVRLKCLTCKRKDHRSGTMMVSQSTSSWCRDGPSRSPRRRHRAGRGHAPGAQFLLHRQIDWKGGVVPGIGWGVVAGIVTRERKRRPQRTPPALSVARRYRHPSRRAPRAGSPTAFNWFYFLAAGAGHIRPYRRTGHSAACPGAWQTPATLLTGVPRAPNRGHPRGLAGTHHWGLGFSPSSYKGTGSVCGNAGAVGRGTRPGTEESS